MLRCAVVYLNNDGTCKMLVKPLSGERCCSLCCCLSALVVCTLFFSLFVSDAEAGSRAEAQTIRKFKLISILKQDSPPQQETVNSNSPEQQNYRMAGEVTLPHEALPGLVQSTHLFIQDNVISGCWTNTRDVTERIRLILHDAGVSVGDARQAYGYSPIMPRLELLATGERLEEACLVSVQLVLYFTNNTQLNFAHEDAVASVRTHQSNIMWMRTQAIVSNDPVNEYLETWAAASVAELSEQIIAARSRPGVVQALESWGFRNSAAVE